MPPLKSHHMSKCLGVGKLRIHGFCSVQLLQEKCKDIVFAVLTCSWPCSPPGPPGPGQNCSCLLPSTPQPWGKPLYTLRALAPQFGAQTLHPQPLHPQPLHPQHLHPQQWPSTLEQPSGHPNSLHIHNVLSQSHHISQLYFLHLPQSLYLQTQFTKHNHLAISLNSSYWT